MRRSFFTLMILVVSCFIANAQTHIANKNANPLLAANRTGGQINPAYPNEPSFQLSAIHLRFSNSLIVSSSYKAYEYNHVEKRQVGQSGRARRSIVSGALIGAGAGAIAGLIIYQKPSDPNPIFDLGAGGSVIAGAFVGALTGAIVGYFIKRRN